MGLKRETHLWCRWSRRENDFVHHWPKHAADGHLLHAAMTRGLWGTGTRSFLQELEERGYDLTTLRFSVRLANPKEPK